MCKLILNIALISILTFGFSIGFAQPYGEPDIKMEMTAKKVVITEKVVDGKKVTEETFESADKAFPEDILQYDLKYWNEGDGVAKNLSIVGPIPYNTFFIDETATKLENAEMKYSLDMFFKITEQSLSRFKELKFPKEILDKLTGLKDREYDTEEDFAEVIDAVLGTDEANQEYKPIILNQSIDNNKPKTYNLPPLKYKVIEVNEKGDEKEVEKTATPDMYTSIQWNLKQAFKPEEELTLSYRVQIK